MKIPNLYLALSFLLLIGISSCAEQRDHSAAKVKTIASLSFRHTTPKLVQDKKLSLLISSLPGTVYSEEKINDDIKSLWESGLVDDVKFSAKPNGDSVDLIASVSTRRGCCGPVLFVGNSAFSDSKLLKQLSAPVATRISKATSVVYDVVTDERIIHRDDGLKRDVLPLACKELEHYYHTNGFPDAIVTIRYTDDETLNFSGFIFVIDENPRHSNWQSK